MERSTLETVAFTVVFLSMTGTGLEPERLERSSESNKAREAKEREAKEQRAKARLWRLTWSLGKKESNQGETPGSKSTDEGLWERTVLWGAEGHSTQIETLLQRVPRSNPPEYENGVARVRVDPETKKGTATIKRFKTMTLTVEYQDPGEDPDDEWGDFGSLSIDLAPCFSLKPIERYFHFNEVRKGVDINHGGPPVDVTLPENAPRQLKLKCLISATKGVRPGQDNASDLSSSKKSVRIVAGPLTPEEIQKRAADKAAARKKHKQAMEEAKFRREAAGLREQLLQRERSGCNLCNVM